MINTTITVKNKTILEKLNRQIKNILAFQNSLKAHNFTNLDFASKQFIVDNIFSSRDSSSDNFWGNSYSEIDSKYFGITLPLKPIDYLNMAQKRNIGVSDYETASKDIEEKILPLINKERKMIRMGVPFLTCDINEQDKTITIVGHEGRHRADAIRTLFRDTTIPVDIKFLGEIRRHDLNMELLDYNIINQDGSDLSTSFRDLLPEHLKNQSFLGVKKNMDLDNDIKDINAYNDSRELLSENNLVSQSL